MRPGRPIGRILDGRAFEKVVRFFESRSLLIGRRYDSQSEKCDPVIAHTSHISKIGFVKSASRLDHFVVGGACSRKVSKIIVCGVPQRIADVAVRQH